LFIEWILYKELARGLRNRDSVFASSRDGQASKSTFTSTLRP
jgi:hypothetical protein